MSSNPLVEEITRLRARIEELEAELAYLRGGLSPSLPAKVKMSGLRLEKWVTPVLELFLTRRYVSHETIDALGDELNWGDLSSYRGVAIHHLRRSLRGKGVDIITVWGEGYTIDAKSQRQLRRLVYGKSSP